jgi:hypothetical protein
VLSQIPNFPALSKVYPPLFSSPNYPATFPKTNKTYQQEIPVPISEIIFLREVNKAV